LGSFLKNCRNSTKIGATFSTEKVIYYFWQKRVGLYFGRFFPKLALVGNICHNLHTTKTAGWAQGRLIDWKNNSEKERRVVETRRKRQIQKKRKERERERERERVWSKSKIEAEREGEGERIR
jgi:hypothetical protein